MIKQLTDSTHKRDVEGISTRNPSFNAEIATSFAKMRENALKRNKALLKVRRSRNPQKLNEYSCIINDFFTIYSHI
jgi:hypothetical protein